MAENSGFKSGFAGIIGAPNAGKSTLVNVIVGEKVAIVTDKPQTTRRRILGIKTLPTAQLILVDTPGIHRSDKILNVLMVKSAFKTIKESDIIIHIVDVKNIKSTENSWIEAEIRRNKKNTPVFLVINKIDLINKNILLPIIDEFSKKEIYDEIIPVSALKNDGVNELVDLLIKYLPEGEKLYPDDIRTDQTERVIVAEIIREKLFNVLKEELPYSIDILIDDFDESNEELIKIYANIFVEKESQKAIVIGAGGKMLKFVGQQAREEIEKLFGCRIFLQLWVKVKKNWTRDKQILRNLGYL
jgi:GTP-binding protein Era